MFLRLLIVVIVLWVSGVRAQTTSYVYDANGRVVAVTQNTTSEQYTYDALGHVGQISAPISVGQIAAFAFMPTHGISGVQVTIDGQGFSSTIANDSVSFNGTPATVLSASSTQLVVDVPNGASTGAISVTVGGQTAVSSAMFVIDDTGMPPTITQVTPVVAVGGAVTVTGTHLDPIAGSTGVQMSGAYMTLTSAADAQLQYIVPSTEVSGHITVETPYGTATSTSPVAILPSSVVSEINGAPASHLMANGTPLSVGTQTAGQMSVLTFDAPQGGNYELTLNGITITGSSATEITVNVYGPTGAVVMTYSCYTTNPGASCRLPLWSLTPGTYTAVVSPPNTSSIISFNAIAEPDTLGPTLALNTSTPVNLAAGEVERLTFNANAGSTVALQLSGISTLPSGQAMYVQVYAPGVVPTASNSYVVFDGTSSATVNLQNLPATGTYTAVVSIIPGTPGSANLMLAPGVNGTMTENGNAQSYQDNEGGENVYLTFNANQGDNLELTLSDLAISGSSATSASVNVYNSGGTYIGSTTCYTTSPGAGCRLPLWNLAAGTYSAVIGPPNASSVISFNAVLQSDTVGPVLADNTPTTLSLSPNTVERLTFNANQGANLELTFSGISITGSSNTQISVNVLNSAGASVMTYQCYTTSPGASCRIPLWNMTDGTYTAVVASIDIVSQVGFTTVLAPDVIGPTLAADTPATVGLATGEVERLTFTANAGESVALQLSGVSTTPAGQAMYVQVYAPGVVPTANNYYTIFDASSSTTVNLQNLPAGGTYTAVVSIISGTPGNAQLTFAPSVTTSITDNGTAQNDQANIGGQNVYLSFSANQGENLELTFNDVTVTGSNAGGMNVVVYSPTGVGIMSYYCSTTSPGASCRIPLWNLSTTGTYSVVASAPTTSSLLSFNAILEPDTIGPTLAIGTPTAVNLAAGEVERLTFTANAGDTVALQLSGVTTTPTGQAMYVQVYAPGTVPSASNDYTIFDTTSSTTATLSNVPNSGTYTAVVSIIPGIPGNAQLTLGSQ